MPNKCFSQVEADPKIKNLVKNLDTDAIELIFDILRIIHKKLKADYQNPNKLKYFRQRTASEILESGISYGCTDYALVAIVLLRERGVRVQYVETFRKKWLESKEKNIEGHVFIEVKIDNQKYIIDAERACLMKWYDRYVVYKKGRDSWDIGIKGFEDMKKVANNFRKNYIKKQRF